MHPLERFNDFSVALSMALFGFQKNVWTAMPGNIVDYDANKLTCSVQIGIQMSTVDQKGNVSLVNLPLLVDVPVMFPHGGGFSLTFPIKKDDPCLVVFANRCMNAWWVQGGIQPQEEFRMHDLSDGFAIVGPYTQNNLPDAPPTDTVQLRSDDGNTFVEINSSQNVNITAPNGVNITGDINVSGKITAQGDVTGQGTSLHNHKHGGVTTGGGQTLPPV